MSGLGRAVADMVSRAQAIGAAPRAAVLQETTAFGDNPGGLRMWVHAPEGLALGSALVVVLHGCGQSAAGYVEDSGWLELADRYGFALLCPEQVRTNNPNLCFTWFDQGDTVRGRGEAASIASMVRQAVLDHDIDPERVFVTGLSAGGAMTAVMLAAYPELFAAGAVVAGLPYGVAASMPEALGAMRAVPTMSPRAWGDKVRRTQAGGRRWPKIAIWHGDADATVAPGAADALVAQWTDVHGVCRSEQGESVTSRHRVTRWRNASGDVVVEAHRIAGLGHGVPIAADGPEGYGAAAPWVLEAGVSASLTSAREWGLVDGVGAHTVAPRRPRRQVPHTRRAALGDLPPVPVDVQAVISRALRSAGLMQ